MKKTVLILLMSMALLLPTGCSLGETEYEIVVKDVVLENGEGTYTKAQIVLPSGTKDEKLPLVTLSHGFRGTMDSAGGETLSHILASAGIATIRMDYSHYKGKNSKKQTNQYTVSTMIEDQKLCIQYMIDHYRVDRQRIGLYGRSMGGRVAMIMANENQGGYDYKALALVAPAGNATALQYYIGGKDKWDDMKKIAHREGSVTHQGIVLTPKFFLDIENNNPCDTAEKFNYPVLVIYNLQDYVVLPRTSIECADAYADVEKIQVNSVGGHGYEMSNQKSKLRDKLMDELTDFFLTSI